MSTPPTDDSRLPDSETDPQDEPNLTRDNAAFDNSRLSDDEAEQRLPEPDE